MPTERRCGNCRHFERIPDYEGSCHNQHPWSVVAGVSPGCEGWAEIPPVVVGQGDYARAWPEENT